MSCSKSCNLDFCSATDITNIVKQIHFPPIPNTDNFTKVDQDLRLTTAGSRWLSIIAKTISNILLELRYCKIKFHPTTYMIIRVKYSLWSLWYHQIMNYFSTLTYYPCDGYPEVILQSAKDIEKRYTEELVKQDGEIVKYFLELHSQIFKVFYKRIDEILNKDLPKDEILDNIGMLLSGGLAYSVCEATSIDTFIQDCPHIFILPEVFYLNKEINIFKLLHKSFPNQKFKIYYINPSPETRTIVKWYLEQENLLDYAVTY